MDARAKIRPRGLLALAYAQDVAPLLLRRMEEHARRLGLPLDTLELLGQDGDVCRRFAEACDRGRADDFLAKLDVPRLEQQRKASRRQVTLLLSTVPVHRKGR